MQDDKDTELRIAIMRLMEFRHEVLRPLWKSYDDRVYRYDNDSMSATHITLRLMENPVWHRLEDALK